MCNRHLLFFLIAALISAQSPGQQVRFSKGVNLTGWFQADNARQIQFSKFTKQDLINIRSLGCDVIRLPINLHAMTSGDPDYVPDALFLEFLDQVVNWTEELQIHLILDNHTFDPSANTDPAVEAVLLKVWSQMAHHFRERSAFLYYEILNEPHGIDDSVWNDIQQNVIDAIRSEDTTHFIIVGPANWNNYKNLKNLPVYNDPKLIYTFHFYDPFVFTHQGASWVDPSMAPLAGVPFPYNASRMPSTPESLRGTWIEQAISNYPYEGTAAKVKQLIDIAAAFQNERHVPVYCGEFGVYQLNSPPADRVAWYDLVRSYLDEKNISWTIWDYTGGFGLFEKDSPEYFDYDLNLPLLRALNFNIPPQDEYHSRPLVKSLAIYQDGVGDDILNASSAGNGVLDFYSSDNPVDGSYCIFWTGVGQYDAIAFDFRRDLDLSLVKNHSYRLEFYVRGNSSSAKFDVRFIDSKKNADDHPWRMGKTLTGIPADNQWHLVQIPLTDLEGKGAWDGSWFPPEPNTFEWQSVDRFEIVPEYQSLEGVEFWFDDIRLAGEDITVSVAEEVDKESFISVYPNPVTAQTNIEYAVPEQGSVEIGIYSIQGRILKHVLDGFVSPGRHVVRWDGTDDEGEILPLGLYFIRMMAGPCSRSVKVTAGK